MLKKDEKKTEFKEKCKKAFSNIQIDICYSEEIKWDNIKKILKSQAEKVIGTQKKDARKLWMTDEIVELINERRKYKNQISTQEQQQYKRKRNEVQRKVKK